FRCSWLSVGKTRLASEPAKRAGVELLVDFRVDFGPEGAEAGLAGVEVGQVLGRQERDVAVAEGEVGGAVGVDHGSVAAGAVAVKGDLGIFDAEATLVPADAPPGAEPLAGGAVEAHDRLGGVAGGGWVVLGLGQFGPGVGQEEDLGAPLGPELEQLA